MRHVVASAVGVVLALVLLVSLTPAAAPAQGVIKVGILPLISYAPIYVAVEKGFFKEEGLEVELIRFASGAKMMAPLATGEIQVASGSASAGLFNSIAKGADFRIVADKGQIRPGHGFVQLIVRKDLLDSGAVKSVKDLEGRTVANHARGIINDYILYAIEKERGLDRSKLNLVYMEPPKIYAALKSKAIDAAVTVEPWTVRAEMEGLAVRYIYADQLALVREMQIAEIFYSGKFIREQEAAARKFMKVYLRGIRYFKERGLKNDEIVTIIEKYTKVPRNMISASTPFYLDNDGKVLVESIEKLQDFFYEEGLVKQKLPMDKVVDLRFLK